MPLKMNSQLNYSLDDIAQIYLTSLDNLTYELIQAERSFGFGNKTFTNPTSEQIDLAITSRKQISESAIKRLLNLLNSDSNLPKLKLMCDGKVANGNGFGFKDFAIIVDQSYIWLLRRKVDKIQTEQIGEILVKISNEFEMFLVDNAKLFVVDSRIYSELIEYLNAED